MNKPLAYITLFTLSLFLFSKPVSAADFDITCNPNGCSDVPAIFNEGGMHPGQTVSKTLKVTNGYNESRSFALELQNFQDSTPSMGDALEVTIFDAANNTVVYGPGSVTQWKKDGFLHLGGIDPGISREFKFQVYFSDVGNDYKNQTLKFDIKMGFEDTGGGGGSESNSAGGGGLVAGAQNVLGAATSFGKSLLAPEIVTVPEVKGVSCQEPETRWWLPLLAEAVILILYIVRTAKTPFNRWMIFPLLVVLIVQIIHNNTGCSCSDSIWCQRFLQINLGIFSLSFISYFLKRH